MAQFPPWNIRRTVPRVHYVRSMWMLRPPSCVNRTKYSTPPACSNAIWIASRIDLVYFIRRALRFARPPRGYPLAASRGTAAPGETGAVSEPDGAGAAEPKSGKRWTLNVTPLFRHYFSGNSSLNLRLLPTNQALRGSAPPCPLGGVASKAPLLSVAESRLGL